MSIPTATPSTLTLMEVTRLIDENFPQIHASGRSIQIESVEDRRASVRLIFSEQHVRPGGTIAGPAMFTLADFGIYVALIATLGAAALPAVTANLNISFLKRPERRDLIAEARIIRLGRRLAYADVALHSDGPADMVAHATGSYALAA